MDDSCFLKAMYPISAIGVAGSVVGIGNLGLNLPRPSALRAGLTNSDCQEPTVPVCIWDKSNCLRFDKFKELLPSTPNLEGRPLNDRIYDDINLYPVLKHCFVHFERWSSMSRECWRFSWEQWNMILSSDRELSKTDQFLKPLSLTKVIAHIEDLESLKVHLILMLRVAALAKRRWP